jgi:hypothetical protein
MPLLAAIDRPTRISMLQTLFRSHSPVGETPRRSRGGAARAALTLIVVAVLSGCASRAADPIANMDVSLRDGRLAAAVRSALLSDPFLGVRAIAIDARDGVVTLSGTVCSADELARVQQLARGVRGVRTATASLFVEPRCGGS